MPKSRNSFPLLALVLLAFSPAVAEAADEKSDLASIERRAQAVYRMAGPAVVRIAWKKDREEPLGSGVIVTADGHVLTAGGSPKSREGASLVLILSDGRRVPGTALGWSGEWNLGLIKIAQKGPWPCARFREKADVRAGEVCLALGYLPRGGFALFDAQPALRLGHITESAHPLWLPSSCKPSHHGEGLFDLDGRLIGMTTALYPAIDYAVCTSVEVAKTHWEDLIAGKNLDREWLFPADEDRPAAQAAKPSTAEPKGDEKRISAAIEKAKAASVRMVAKDSQQKVSGVIVTADGYVITCGHHFMLPGHQVTLLLSDGRNAAGRIVGTNLVSDVGLVKITDTGPWPHADLGRSTAMKASDPCLVLGYPADRQDRQPLVSRTQVVDSPDLLWSHLLYTSSSRPVYGGMSGGGVFDLEGRVVATNSGSPAQGHSHVRIELYRKQWDLLAAGRPGGVMSTDPLAEIKAAFRRVANGLPAFVVEVLRDHSPCALGTIVRSDGRILTKASEVYGSVSCRLADGRVLPAALEKESREHDLAILKVEAKNLPAAEWSGAEGALPGSLIAALVPGTAPSVGVVSLPARSIAPQGGWLGVRVEDSDRGSVVADDSTARWFDVPLRKGDVILHLEGRQKPNLATCLDVLTAKAGNPAAGDPVRVGVRRQDKSLEFRFPLAPTQFLLPPNRSDYENRRDSLWGRESLRRSGFPSVFDTALPLTPTQCGGPLIDHGGRVVGISIASVRAPSAWEPPAQIHVIPAAVAKRIVTD